MYDERSKMASVPKDQNSAETDSVVTLFRHKHRQIYIFYRYVRGRVREARAYLEGCDDQGGSINCVV